MQMIRAARSLVQNFRRGARQVGYAAGRVKGPLPVRVVFQATAIAWHAVDLDLAPLEFVLATMELCGAMRFEVEVVRAFVQANTERQGG